MSQPSQNEELKSLRVECASCSHLGFPASLRFEAECVLVQCSQCKKVSRLEVEGAKSVATSRGVADADREVVADKPEASEQRCPKCKRPQSKSADSCPGCGLKRARFSQFENGPSGASELGGVWSVVDEDWQNTSHHEQFLARTVERKSYREAAGRYRQAAEVPERKEFAEKMLGRLQTMAAADLLQRTNKGESENEREPFKGVVVLLIGLVLLAALGAGYLLLKKGKKQVKQPERGTQWNPPKRF